MISITMYSLLLVLWLSLLAQNVKAAFNTPSLLSHPPPFIFLRNSRTITSRQRSTGGGSSFDRYRQSRIRPWPLKIKEVATEDTQFTDKIPEPDNDPFSACWNTTSFNVNPIDDDKINKILQGLCSPAPQSFFVLNRAVQLYHAANIGEGSENNEGLHDILVSLLYLVKPGFQLVYLSSPNSSSCGDQQNYLLWKVIPANEIPENEWSIVSLSTFTSSSLSTKSTLEMAHEALEYVVSHSISSEQQSLEESSLQQQKSAHKVSQIAQMATDKLKWTLGTDIRGRASADAAFCFALAGANNEQDQDIFQTLAIVAGHELKRTGARRSFRNRDILQIVAKLAASGLRGEQVESVYRTAAKCLLEKGEESTVVEPLLYCKYDLLSSHPLLWVWRFSSRQRKPSTNKENPPEDNTFTSSTESPQLIDNNTTDNSPMSNWWKAFEDPTRPLVVDVGCGMGVSLLGMSQINNQTKMPPSCASTLTTASWDDCNYVGCDLSNLGIGYASSIAARWNVHNRIQFVRTSAQTLLEDILNNYPGNSVPLIMIQFPTPFQMPDKISSGGGGNTQLPADTSSGFMASAALLRTAAGILSQKTAADGGHGGRILLQSNCEDVAVIMRQMAMDYGFQSVDVPNPVTQTAECNNLDNGGEKNLRIPLRMQEWIQQGGDRAVGAAWSCESLLPPNCETETAVACKMQGTPIHRCLLEMKR